MTQDIETKPAETVENVKVEVKEKTTKKKRTFKLHAFTPPEGMGAPKNGGSYKSASPAGAARKAANRWVLPKNEFSKVRTFYLREVGAPKGKNVYEFSAMRVKLSKPKTYKRGDKEITVESKVEIVNKPAETPTENESSAE